MKKTLIISALATSLVAVAFAADATTTQQMPSPLPPMMTTGSSTIDAQVKALRQSYEVKIKALQQEYLTQLKAIVGTRAASSTKSNNGLRLGEVKKGMMGTTTASGSPMMRPRTEQEQEGQGEENRGGDRGQMMGRPQVEGASADNSQEQEKGFMRFFRGFFGR